MHYQLERNYGCRVSDSWTYRGLRAAVLENELLRIVILLDKGADILGSMSSIYYISVAGVVSVWFGSQAYTSKNGNNGKK